MIWDAKNKLDAKQNVDPGIFHPDPFLVVRNVQDGLHYPPQRVLGSQSKPEPLSEDPETMLLEKVNQRKQLSLDIVMVNRRQLHKTDKLWSIMLRENVNSSTEPILAQSPSVKDKQGEKWLAKLSSEFL